MGTEFTSVEVPLFSYKSPITGLTKSSHGRNATAIFPPLWNLVGMLLKFDSRMKNGRSGTTSMTAWAEMIPVKTFPRLGYR